MGFLRREKTCPHLNIKTEDAVYSLDVDDVLKTGPVAVVAMSAL